MHTQCRQKILRGPRQNSSWDPKKKIFIRSKNFLARSLRDLVHNFFILFLYVYNQTRTVRSIRPQSIHKSLIPKPLHTNKWNKSDGLNTCKTRPPLHVVLKRLCAFRVHTFIERQMHSSVRKLLIKINLVKDVWPLKSRGPGQLPLLPRLSTAVLVQTRYYKTERN